MELTGKEVMVRLSVGMIGDSIGWFSLQATYWNNLISGWPLSARRFP